MFLVSVKYSLGKKYGFQDIQKNLKNIGCYDEISVLIPPLTYVSKLLF